jgi:hypothetical protein
VPTRANRYEVRFWRQLKAKCECFVEIKHKSWAGALAIGESGMNLHEIQECEVMGF